MVRIIDKDDIESKILFEKTYLTPQEHKFLGSSVDVGQRENDPDFYVPIGIVKGYEPQIILDLREHLQTYQVFSTVVTDKKNEKIPLGLVDIELAPLNPETYQTKYDPKPVSDHLKIAESIAENLRLRK